MPKFTNQASADKWALVTYGCTHAEAVDINGRPLADAAGFAYAFRTQKRNAARRGVPWRFGFREWVSVWINSGKWDLRGVGIGRYCMARHGDVGAYEASNVAIQLCTQNSRDGIEKARPAIALSDARRTGSGRGWTYRLKGSKPYQVYLSKKYIGCFATAEEAECAYRAAAERHRSSKHLMAPTLHFLPAVETATDGNSRCCLVM